MFLIILVLNIWALAVLSSGLTGFNGVKF